MADEPITDTVEQPPAQEEGPVAESTLDQVVSEETPDELAALRRELEAARAKEAEYLDGWQRARAELSNARKRFDRDREQAYTTATGQILIRLLPIVDDFERALATLPANLSGLTWVEGVVLIYHKLRLLLEAEGVKPIEATGRPFDPVSHQAVTHEPSDDVPEGQVIGEVQKGYLQGDRVLRPALVRVSAGPAASPAADDIPPTE